MLTVGSVPEGILYRTNCLSTLEEKNIQKFLDIVKEELKIKNVFGKDGEKIFKDFQNFHKVRLGKGNMYLLQSVQFLL